MINYLLRNILAYTVCSIILATSFISTASAKKTTNANQESSIQKLEKRVITVFGMVCAYCANSIEKRFSKKKEVDHINVNFDEKTVTVYFKPNKTLSNEQLKKVIKSSGFKVTEIK